MSLTDLLDLEKSSRAGDKGTAIRSLGVSERRYYLILNNLLGSEAALAVEPMLIGRLRRLREDRHGERAVRKSFLP